MKKTRFLRILLLTVSLSFTMSSCSEIDRRFDDLNHRFEDINQRLDFLENTTIASVRTQIFNIQSSLPGIEQTVLELKNYVEILKNENVSHFSSSITNIEGYISELNVQLSDIKSYTQTVIQQETVTDKVWIEITLKTLNLYRSVQNLLSLAKVEIENVTKIINDYSISVSKQLIDFNVSLAALVNKTEVSIMKWVNEHFTAYYTIAELNAHVHNMIVENNVEISNSIDALIVRINETDVKITKFYENLVREAISSYSGTITEILVQKMEKVIIDLNVSIESINAKIVDIENRILIIDNSLNTINQQVTAINVSIEQMIVLQEQITQYIAVLKEEGNTYNTQITLLQQISSELSVRIQELSVYVETIVNDFDITISDTRNWANVTFATIEQYNIINTTIINIQAMFKIVQKNIETINQTIVSINADITNVQNNVNITVQDLGNSTREWVNEKLAGYLTIKDADALFAELRAKIGDAVARMGEYTSKLEAFDESYLSKTLSELEYELVQMRKNITAEIEKAVEEAISSHNGDISDELMLIKDKVLALKAQLSSTKDDLYSRINDLSAYIEKKLYEVNRYYDELREDICGQVQSIVHVPTYSDGSVALSRGKCAVLFEIVPSSVVTDIVQNVGSLSFDVLNVQTRAGSSANPLTPMKIVDASEDGGFLKVTVDFSSLDEDVFSGHQAVMGRLKFESSSSSVASKYFSLVPFDLPSTKYEYVDLGLSVKWATFNVGATRPEEYGGYFAWGEVKEKSSNEWNTYKWCNGTENSLTKYNTDSSWGIVDKKTVLNLEDDVAHVNWGGNWRMPTSSELQELRDNCNFTFTSLNDISGYEVVSKKNDNWIFLPCGDNFIPTHAYYWSSSLCLDEPKCAFGLGLEIVSVYPSREDVLLKDISPGDRSDLYFVRPVYGERVNVTGVSLDKSSLTLSKGNTYPFKVEITPYNASEKRLVWSSSDTSVAMVDNYTVGNGGVVTAVNAGSAVITVTTIDGGYTAVCKVTVVAALAEPEAVDLGLPSGLK